MKQVQINKSLEADVKSVIGSMYSMNAPNAKGYLFNPAKGNKSIATGMFCNFDSEITSDRWTYYFDYKTKLYYKL